MKISTGRSRRDLNWKVIDISREDLREKLSTTYRTRETMNEYKAAKKDVRDSIKDIGGFVGGVVEGGRRRRDSVKSRSLVTLDADYAKVDSWSRATMLCDYEMYCYSTHSHTPLLPRLRFVIPLDREVTSEEYEPIARMVAKDIGINQFDVTTYEASRLMYWPSTATDGDFYYQEQLGELLSADATLARYKNWRDTVEWPLADQEQTVQIKTAKAQGDPASKPGIVGIFCRAYDIPSAIDEYLSDVYESCDEPNRYTYLGGSTSAGVVLYQEGQFSYSHHATDPTGGRLCNAFDLVRLHKFHELDYLSAMDTPVNRLPSYAAMQKLVNEDTNVRRLRFEELDITSEELDDSDWMTKLEPMPNGSGYLHSVDNLILIMDNDPNVKGKIRMDTFVNRGVVDGRFPWTLDSPDTSRYWTDYDSASLRHYLEQYKLLNIKKLVDDALKVVSNRNGFHPVRNYLNSLTWDGVPRVETVFIDYLSAEDNKYTRAVTRKWLTAGAARILTPGCKFDNMLVLVGTQGIGKSYLARKLSKEWFSDTEIRLNNGKEPFEALRGKWIVEWAELTGLKKTEVESIKSYISSQVDSYRPAYAENVQDFKRQAIFIGSTNDTSFLRDATGNRRFWPIRVHTNQEDPQKIFREFTDEVVDQVWAEAVQIFKAGETLYLDYELAKQAASVQEGYMEDNPWLGYVSEYLDRDYPANWEDMTFQEKQQFALGYYLCDDYSYQRNVFSLPEIEWELFGVKPGSRKPFEVKELHNQLLRLPGWRRSETRQSVRDYGKQVVYIRKEGADGVRT